MELSQSMQPILNFIIFISILFLIFLAIRQVTLWYFKINQIIILLEQIEENTRNNQHQDTEEK